MPTRKMQNVSALPSLSLCKHRKRIEDMNPLANSNITQIVLLVLANKAEEKKNNEGVFLAVCLSLSRFSLWSRGQTRC